MNPAVERSLVVPVYRNEENISDLLVALDELARQVVGLEVVLVVDGSPDRSYAMLAEELPRRSYPSQLLLHSRNFGSFAAIRTGMEAARGKHLAVMAADLQEPPDLVLNFFEALSSGDADVVFGVRRDRRDPWLTRLSSNLYWRIYKRFVVADIPDGGVDIFACNREVRNAVLALEESNSSLVAQLFWVGFRRAFVPYTRRARQDGESAWSTRRRLRYMADSIFAFTDLPILALLWFGIIGIAFSTLVGLVTVVARLSGAIDTPGFTTTIVVVSFMFSLLMTTQGIIGMYLWRAFENTKNKPGSILMKSQAWPEEGDA